MEHPRDIALPFFAYGIFKPGQLAYFQLRDHVERVDPSAEIEGAILLRDGLPILNLRGDGRVPGALLEFIPEQASVAYERIIAMEPQDQYRWDVGDVHGTCANVLVGVKPTKGSVHVDSRDGEWDGWSDPLFTAGLDVVEETLACTTFDWDLKPLFRLQMAYLLLWSSIERYASLRYGLGGKVMEKVRQIASEPAFGRALAASVHETRTIQSAKNPSSKETLDANSPKKALEYYYQVRSNIAHRGKSAVGDHDRLDRSTRELLAIFREVLRDAQRDAESGSSHAR